MNHIMMSWLRITSGAVWRTRLRSVEQIVCMTKRPMYCSTNQCHNHALQCRNNIYTPDHYSVHKLSLLRKTILFTDDLLQKHIKQLVAEWNCMQWEETGDQSGSGQLSLQNSGNHLHFLEQIVSKVKQHQQYSADISELEDITSGMYSIALHFNNTILPCKIISSPPRGVSH